MIKQTKRYLLLTLLSIIVASCAISYKFNGASIDYSKTKTIEIDYFPNQALLVYQPLEIEFNDALKDIFVRNTKLELVKQGGDMELHGAIVSYDYRPLAVKENNLASETELIMSVRFRFVNNKEKGQDKEETITARRTFPSDKQLNDVQDALIKEMNKEIIDGIFNKITSNW